MSWGLCKDCKWWQIEPDSTGGDQALGLCIDQDLQPFLLRINGSGGCNHSSRVNRHERKAPATRHRRRNRCADPGPESRVRASALERESRTRVSGAPIFSIQFQCP
jgi:hypothetical protein